MNQRSEGITALLLEYARAEPPSDVRAVMELSVLDWAACGIAGQAEGGFGPWAAGLDGQGEATRFDGRLDTPAQAALVNGTLSHALDYDDTHFAHIGHPSVVVVSAALAVAQTQGGGMARMVDAALIGAEAAVAVGLWLGRGHYQVGYHQTATAGAFGATVAAARLLGLEAEQLRHALGLCATMASGLKGQFGTMGKPLNAGLAARTGVEAAMWARAGMTSAPDGLAGPLGFGETHHGAGDPVAFEWRMGAVSHKFHACCHGLHATLEAVRDIDLAGAKAITVHTHPRWMSVCNQPAPDTGLSAKFSYAHVLAMAAHGRDTGDIAAFSDACAQDPALVAFRNRVRVVADEGLSEMQARVEVDGAVHNHDLDAALPFEARAARVRAKAHALVGDRAEALRQAITRGDLERFAALLVPHPGQ
ncbi:MmgE/PrpD family protein [uncultured Tateyamaria sp.]|uniref:MmgE/PrpD family protein n=1 Tax=uncultured Tateyamaria sp. TaxID=455651 RepID=UPI00260239CD|nr:MmgE/PrpD family protein [uncultured Tateyamaria sp.]